MHAKIVCPRCGAGPNLYHGSRCDRCGDPAERTNPLLVLAVIALGLTPLTLLLIAWDVI